MRDNVSLEKGVNMAKGKPYPPEFKAEAVRLHRMSSSPLAQTAREIDVSDWTLSRWLRQAEIDDGKAAGLTTEEREELRRLRRQNKILQEEKEILKKAALFFARETDQRKRGSN
jgi:transposase